jgi:hypothetical protein
MSAEILFYPGLGASYGMLQLCGIVSNDKSETTSGMQFVAVLFISGLKSAIQKNSDFQNSKPTVGMFIIKIVRDQMKSNPRRQNNNPAALSTKMCMLLVYASIWLPSSSLLSVRRVYDKELRLHISPFLT